MPQILQVNGRQLQVDGRPFLILGLQWDCDSCFSRAEMNPLFAHAARMGANTAALPLYWREIEPEPGVYDFDMLDERLAQARANGLRLVLLWFATWKNACSFYAPDYIKQDPKTYRLAQDAGSQPRSAFAPPVRRPESVQRRPASGDIGRIRRRAHRDPSSGERTGILGSDAIATPQPGIRRRRLG